MKSLLLTLSVLAALPALGAEIPGVDVPYATYRQQLLKNGFRPAPDAPCCGPYPETSTGNRIGSAHWVHPGDGMKVELLLWPCKHGWCLAPPLLPEPEAGQ